MPLSNLDALKVDERAQTIRREHPRSATRDRGRAASDEAPGFGRLVNVSSIGRTMYPMAAAYRATKFAVRAISEGCARSPRYQRIAASGGAFQ